MMNSTILEGKTIIVTGGATGIGQAFALTSAAHGAKVMVADMNPADETLDLIRSNGGEAEYVKTDVSDEASAKAMAKATQDWSGRVDG
ncbi:MAG: SDR family NAD(P)-dependent oxidoreductase, partial [Betaproteobacteria bacterium]